MSDTDVIIINSKPFVSEKYVCAVAYTIQKLIQLVGRPVMAYVTWDEELRKFWIDVDVDREVFEELRKWTWDVGYDDYVFVSNVMIPSQKERLKKLLGVGGDKSEERV